MHRLQAGARREAQGWQALYAGSLHWVDMPDRWRVAANASLKNARAAQVRIARCGDALGMGMQDGPGRSRSCHAPCIPLHPCTTLIAPHANSPPCPAGPGSGTHRAAGRCRGPAQAGARGGGASEGGEVVWEGRSVEGAGYLLSGWHRGACGTEWTRRCPCMVGAPLHGASPVGILVASPRRGRVCKQP